MASSEVKVQWSLEADYFQACSCDYGCPCEFEAPPTQGFCEGIGAYLITQGTYGNVSLNGIAFGSMSISQPPCIWEMEPLACS